jgi:hypothetical protein
MLGQHEAGTVVGGGGEIVMLLRLYQTPPTTQQWCRLNDWQQSGRPSPHCPTLTLGPQKRLFGP